MECRHLMCPNAAEDGRDECYRHRLLSVGFSLKAPAVQGQFHRTARDHREEHFGTNDERELAQRGIVRADKY